jgi:pimeloyl-ACP methyl ester carboxylesterase
MKLYEMIDRFSIKIPDQAIDDLKMRLQRTRWTDEIVNSGWKYGADLSYTKELINYWLNTFDWRNTEKEINSYPNYIADIDGIKVHFLHVKSERKNAVPLLITHGWPGSFLEMMKIIPILSRSRVVFDLIIPSIPGFGFSQKINTPGCNLWFIAELWSKLIKELGYKKVVAQGGDFGAAICTALALKHSEIIMGLHLNYIPGSYLPYLTRSEKFSEEEDLYLKSSDEWYKNEGAYAQQHRTKPLTLAFGLNDSPVGLCAWILEKYYGWSDCSGDIESIFSKDELLSNIALYWFTESIHSSIRLYNENSKVPLHFSRNDFIQIPVGIARFHKEEPFPPRRFIERGYNVQYWKDVSPGGHFAAMEQPALFAEEVVSFTEQILRNA